MTPIEKLQQADQLLSEWLTDNTEDDFDEVPEVDEARGLVQEAIEELTAQEPDYWLGFGLQAHTEKPFDGATPVWKTPPAPAQEPVIQPWMKPDALCDRSCLYACTEGFTKFPTCVPPPAPAKHWAGLTAEERHSCTQSPFAADNYRAIEAKLKEKNA